MVPLRFACNIAAKNLSFVGKKYNGKIKTQKKAVKDSAFLLRLLKMEALVTS